MSVAYERLIQHLQEHEFRYHAEYEREMIVADFGGKSGSYRLIARVVAEDQLFIVVGIAPIRVPEGSRSDVAEAITRANYGLAVGKFELDFSDGELRFQAAQILCDDSLEDAVIRRLIGTTLARLDRYMPAILSVIYGNETSQDAIRLVEAG